MVLGSKLDVVDVDGWKSFLKIVIEMLQGKTKENSEKKIGKLNLQTKFKDFSHNDFNYFITKNVL